MYTLPAEGSQETEWWHLRKGRGCERWANKRLGVCKALSSGEDNQLPSQPSSPSPSPSSHAYFWPLTRVWHVLAHTVCIIWLFSSRLARNQRNIKNGRGRESLGAACHKFAPLPAVNNCLAESGGREMNHQ